MALAQEIAAEVEADVDFGQKALDYFEILEKNGHGSKDFGYVFQYIMKNKKIWDFDYEVINYCTHAF